MKKLLLVSLPLLGLLLGPSLASAYMMPMHMNQYGYQRYGGVNRYAYPQYNNYSNYSYQNQYQYQQYPYYTGGYCPAGYYFANGLCYPNTTVQYLPYNYTSYTTTPYYYYSY